MFRKLCIPLITILALTACVPVSTQVVPSHTPVPSATLAPVLPTATHAPAPTATPAVANAQTYHNAAIGFELDYPIGWVIDTSSEAAGTVILWSKKVEGPGTDGVPADIVKIDIVNPSIAVQSLDELVAWEKQSIADSSHTVLDEQPVQLPSGLAAVRMHVSGFGEGLALLALVNGRPLIVAGYGDLSRFDDVARTLRLVPPSTESREWSEYVSQAFFVRVGYPSGWQRVGEADLRLEGPDGFVGLSALGSTANPPDPLNVICDNQAHHKLLPYGTQPQVTTQIVADQQACLIMPSDDQDPVMHSMATLIVSYPVPIDRGGGVVDQFLNVDADKNHIRQIADRLTFLPVSAPAFVRVAVASADNTIQVVELPAEVGSQVSDLTTGFLPRGGAAGGAVYALVSGNETKAVKVDANGEQPLSFVQFLNVGFGVWAGNGRQAARLGWSTTHEGVSQLFVSSPDGSDAAPVHEQPLTPERNSQLVFERWSRDGQSFYFGEEPFGIGGYILFAGASSLYRLNLSDQSVQEIIPFNPAGGRFICWDDLSSDERLAAGHCDGQVVTVLDVTTSQTTSIQPPADVGGFGQIGSARFSPDASRVAFALARGDSSNEQGWVAVSDGLSGGSHVIAASEPGRYFTVVAWLNPSVLLLQSGTLFCAPTCTSELWRVNVDGSGLTKVADGAFVTLVGGDQ